jgi:hypothetical protein
MLRRLIHWMITRRIPVEKQVLTYRLMAGIVRRMP